MKIILLRHGKPRMPVYGTLRACEFHQWIEAYNLAPLDPKSKPSTELVTIAKHCDTIICSDLRRSIESAKVLGVTDIHCIDAIFREFELPYARGLARKWAPKLSPGVWSVLYRILWFMDYAPNCESFSAAKQRAASAANILQSKAESNKTVLFVGHSLLNSFIAKKLLEKGWQGSISLFNKHWEISVFENLNE